jgi:hypothetical protein
MTCRPDCHRPSRTQAHCSVCHRTFSGVGPFDQHRRDGRCIDPATLGMAPNGHGVWRNLIPDAKREQLRALRGGTSTKSRPNTPSLSATT